MPDRWWGRTAALAIALALAGAGAVSIRALADASPALVVSRPDGRILARIEIGGDRSFGLRYRNSLYGSIAEERFAVTDDGRLRLVGLGAEELAVLEEYYATDRPATRAHATGSGAWTAPPAMDLVTRSLQVAATDLGQRTLVVDGRPGLELWRLVDDAEPHVVLRADVP